MEHLEEDGRGPMRQEDITKMIPQPAIGLLYGMETVSMAIAPMHAWEENGSDRVEDVSTQYKETV